MRQDLDWGIFISQEIFKMPSPAFIVDGFQERRALQKLCPGVPIKILNCNGDDVQVQAIIDRVEALFKNLNNKFYPIYFVLDKEDRKMSAKEFEEQISQKLVKLGIRDQFIIGVADRMIENWILSDWKNVTKYLSINIDRPKRAADTLRGKSYIKKLFSDHGEKYEETIDGVELLIKSTPAIMKEHSDSFASFANVAEDHCWWMS